MFGGLVALMVAFAPQASGPQQAKCFAAVSKLPAPAGYRYPVEKDVGGYWQYVRDENGKQASCESADLNGDGVPDYVSFAFRTSGSGFAIVVLYSGTKQYEPHIVWTDPGLTYHPGDGWVTIVGAGPHTKHYSCEDWDTNIVMPAIGVEYFIRPFTDERPGPKPEHRLFWSSDKGATQSQRDLCTAADWARVQRLAR